MRPSMYLTGRGRDPRRAIASSCMLNTHSFMSHGVDFLFDLCAYACMEEEKQR